MAVPTWLDQHIEEWIRPHLKRVPKVEATTKNCIGCFADGSYMELLQRLWVEGKKRAEGRVIVLPGRDTWLFEVLARLEGYPTIFRPEISSGVHMHPAVKGKFKTCYGMDSGHRGSVPMALGCKDFGLVYYSGGMQTRPKHQLIPDVDVGYYSRYTVGSKEYNLALGCYNIYNLLEGHPKYWEPGYCIDPVTGSHVDPTNRPDSKIIQRLDLPGLKNPATYDKTDSTFEACAQLTMYVAKNVTKLKAVKYFIMKVKNDEEWETPYTEG